MKKMKMKKMNEVVFAENEVPNVSSEERMDALLNVMNSDEINMECAMNEAFAYSSNDLFIIIVFMVHLINFKNTIDGIQNINHYYI